MQGSHQMDVAAIRLRSRRPIVFMPDYAPSLSAPACSAWLSWAAIRTCPTTLRMIHSMSARRAATHPCEHSLGAPLTFGTDVLGMLGVANRQGGYDRQQEQLLSVFANQVAVATAMRAVRGARQHDCPSATLARTARRG